MRHNWSLILAMGLLSGCQTPQSVKTLAQSTSTLITETRSASPAVQQYFARQDRHVESRISRWNERRQRAQTFTSSRELLWGIDKKPEDKTRSELIAQIRSVSTVDPLDPPKTVQSETVAPESIAKMTGLLEAVASGKAETAGFYVAYWRALSKSLDALNKDAVSAEAAPAGGGTDTESNAN